MTERAERTEKIDGFLDSVCLNIKYKEAHKEIREELTVHINELEEEFIKEAENEDDALKMAIDAMGDCDEIGRELNKRHKPKTEWPLVGLTAAIAIIGGVAMYISSRAESPMKDYSVNFERYLAFALLGLLIMTCLCFFDYTKLRRLALPVYLLSLALLVGLLIYGGRIGGRVYFSISGMVISTQFIVFLLMLSFAGFVDKARGKGGAEIIKLAALMAISLVPVLAQSLVQGLTLTIGYSALLITAVFKGHFGGSRKCQFIILGALSSAGGLVLLRYFLSAQYRMARILSYLTGGWADPTGAGYQQILAGKWLTASSLFGSASQEASSGLEAALPGAATEYALINVFATLGSAAGTLLIIIIIAYIGRMLITAKRVKDNYGFYLSLAACTMLIVQFIIGILMNFGLFPVAGIYIPFISYGGSGYITSMSFIGLVLSVWRRNNLLPVSQKSNSGSMGNIIKFDDGKLIVDFGSLRKPKNM